MKRLYVKPREMVSLINNLNELELNDDDDMTLYLDCTEENEHLDRVDDMNGHMIWRSDYYEPTFGYILEKTTYNEVYSRVRPIEEFEWIQI